MQGAADRPRLYLYRSLNNIFITAVDDATHKVVFSASTLDKETRQKAGSGGNVKAAEILGVAVAEGMKKKGFSRIVFDRSGYLYHGRVKALAEAMRKGGLEF